MEGEPIVSADSASVAETAPAEVADTQTDVTHGGETTEQTPTTDADTPEPDSSDDDAEDDEDTPPENQTEEQKSESQKRRERRQAREAKQREEAVEAEIARRERVREAEAAAAAADAKIKADAEAWHKRFGDVVGTPQRRQELDQQIEALTEEVGKLKPYAEGTDLDTLEQKQTALSELVAERRRLNEGKRLYDDIDQFQFAQTQSDYIAAGADLPPTHQQKLAASTTVPQALKAIKDGGIALGEARVSVVKDKEIAEWKGKYEKSEAALAAMRTGGAGDGPSPNGRNGGGYGSDELTYERYRSMTTQERIDLRSTPEGRARIDRMTQRASA